MGLASNEGLGRSAGEIERRPKGKAFLWGSTVLTGREYTRFESFIAVRIEGHTPKVAAREVSETAQTGRNFSATRKILFT